MLIAGSRRSSGRALNIVGPATAKCPPPERAETMSKYGQLMTLAERRCRRDRCPI